jgi:toxin-antitoxin system PIN domain toxin
MFLVDTNVFIYAADLHSPEHARCQEMLETWRQRLEPWYTTWPIVYEFLRISTHARVFRRPWSIGSAWHYVEALLASPGLRLLAATQRHREIAAQVFEELPDLGGNLLHDAHTAILMREHGIRRIVSRDTDFRRFRFLEVIDPLADSPAPG